MAIKLFNCAPSDFNDVIAEIFKAKAVLVGSPTSNKGVFFAVAGLLELVKGLKFKDKKAAAFGAYGWSGESVKIISERLEQADFNMINSGIRELWNPDAPALERCMEFGKEVAKAL